MPSKRAGTKVPHGAKTTPRQNAKQRPAQPANNGHRLPGIWILWFGLLAGLFYGWYYGRWEDDSLKKQHREVVIFNPDIESPWDVVDIPGKGKGAIASRDIRQGELLLSEKPLFLVPPTINTSPTEFIWEKVENLTENKKQAFFNLSFVGLAQNKNPEKDKKHLALAIFETNAVSAGSSVGIFPRMARLNHGCSSAFNAVYSWRGQEGVLLIHAIKDIARGSEVLTTYSDTKKPRDERRAYLRDHYGFHCTCGSCALPEAESKASDNRLLAMAQHHSQLAGWMERKISGVEAIDHIKAIWKLGDEEGYWSERGRLAGDAVTDTDADATAPRLATSKALERSSATLVL
ncbi:hypothetical protein CC1G_02952 [Coprinopsis cinerea okayama7|uniref:SET domain-containing protein n=1 Tax=Coprinopsis cinerea (strain Okayama-7 / 130 / ATCC MYA-4618 / FGSC 9003) TaxID=240176 RepID=A8NRV4_COPC7|nr:hypothetical protein CC1G_02952 [Coprinopsis cinerea okayama7\|eukprot:XP_001835864.2 hypothetical protein CC1G_02952 [Coprinopsis cinerea okayama7\